MRALTLALVLASSVAGVALADTLTRGHSLPGAPKPTAPAMFQINAGGVTSQLALHPNGRIATLARNELRLFDGAGHLLAKQPLPAEGEHVAFGAAESVAVELPLGSAVLRYQDLFTRAWNPVKGRPIAPVGLPNGGFAFGRHGVILFTDGEAHELRRLSLPSDYAALALGLGSEGVLALTEHAGQIALFHIGLGEHASLRAAARGRAASWRFEGDGVSLVLEDGSPLQLQANGAVTRSEAVDPIHAVTPLAHGLAVVIHRGQLTLARQHKGALRLGATFDAPVAQTDAGWVVPHVLIARAAANEPAWILTANGLLWRAGDERTVTHVTSVACDSRAARLEASPGRVVLACRDQLQAYLNDGAPAIDGGR